MFVSVVVCLAVVVYEVTPGIITVYIFCHVPVSSHLFITMHSQ